MTLKSFAGESLEDVGEMKWRDGTLGGIVEPGARAMDGDQ